LPPLLRELASRPTRRVIASDTAVSMTGLSTRLRGLSAEQRHRELIELVCSSAATVLGHPSTSEVSPDREFQDLGFDSLTAVELRNRLKAATGLTLSPTLIFDYPTPLALAEHLEAGLATTGTADAERPDRMARFNDIARELQALIDQPDWDPHDKAKLTLRMQTLLTALSAPPPEPEPADSYEDLSTATDSELFAILDEEVGP
jgi:polyketide synthase 7